MASPSVGARTETGSIPNGTTLTINFSQVAGDLVVIFLALSDTAQALSTVGDGFTNLTNANATFHILYKRLVGTEGTSLDVTVGSNTKACAVAYRITGFADPTVQAPEFSTVATGTSTTPDPGTVTPTGGSQDYLFLAAFRQNGEEADDDTWCTAAPGSYTNLTQTTSGTAGVASTNGSIGTAERQNTTASENPGTFTVAQSLAWRAYTVAIHPAPTLAAQGIC